MKKKIVYATNFALWKRELYPKIFSDLDIRFFRKESFLLWLRLHLILTPPKAFYIWGMYKNASIDKFAKQKNIKIIRIEDGFVRSIGLGSFHIPPLSFCTDNTGIYYDSTRSSDLEDILNSYDFASDTELMNEAKECLEFILQHKITKYNLPDTQLSESLYGKKTNPRILCIGQVEDDASIKYGCNKNINNNDLVRLAAAENPDAQIIYKVHPDILSSNRNNFSNPKDVEDIATIITQNMSIDDALTEVDRVYTITSLSGFEALIRGIAVTCLGAPFYSGWGVTDDRQKIARRIRKLSILEIFAASYILYPHYITPDTFKPTTLLNTLKYISNNV